MSSSGFSGFDVPNGRGGVGVGAGLHPSRAQRNGPTLTVGGLGGVGKQIHAAKQTEQAAKQAAQQEPHHGPQSDLGNRIAARRQEREKGGQQQQLQQQRQIAQQRGMELGR